MRCCDEAFFMMFRVVLAILLKGLKAFFWFAQGEEGFEGSAAFGVSRQDQFQHFD